MLKVTGLLPSWDSTKTTSKKSFDKVWGLADKLGNPVNRLSNKVGSESFWPTTLDRESDKAARILRSFCKDGFYEEIEVSNENAPNSNHKQRVLKKIPTEVIQNAVGLAIFTTMRTGLWISGAGGSGVLVARKDDGDWSPPSGIMLHTAGLGFLVGVDIYDCVLVINNRKALEAFTKVRLTLGGEVSAVAGPMGIGGVLEHDGKWKQANRPIFTYLKSRGFYAGVQVDGTIVIERSDENKRFYGEDLNAAEILAGKVRYCPSELKTLMETLKAAEGRIDFGEELLGEIGDEPAPGDMSIQSPQQPPRSPTVSLFGVPEPDDPDPFGVLALELAGLEIREAGTGSRPESSQFEYRPSPTSPLFAQFRRSMDTFASNRASVLSTQTKMSIDRATQTVETQPESPNTSPSASESSKRLTETIKPELVIEKVDEKPEEQVVKSSEPEETESLTKSDEAQDVKPYNETPASTLKQSDFTTPAPFGADSIDYTEISLGPYHEDTDEDLKGSETAVGSSTHSEADDASPDELKAKSTDISIDTNDEDKPQTESDSGEDSDMDEDDADDEDDEEPVVFGDAVTSSAATVQLLKPQFIQARGNLVTIPKRIPPALPPRSPARNSIRSKIDMFEKSSSSLSPLSATFPDSASDKRASSALSEPADVDANGPGDTETHKSDELTTHMPIV